MASKSGPRLNQTSFWVLRSVATAVNEIGRRVISWSPIRSFRRLMIFSPF